MAYEYLILAYILTSQGTTPWLIHNAISARPQGLWVPPKKNNRDTLTITLLTRLAKVQYIFKSAIL